MEWDPIEYRIFETVTGSQMYGTSTPQSDTDFRGICLPPIEVLLDPFQGFEQKDAGFEEDDRSIYALGKWMKLCGDCNPNINELLFAPFSCWTYAKQTWNMIRDNYKLFLSKKVRYTYSGYAFSQLQAIQRHRQWFIAPPKEKPTRKMFGLTDSPRISGEGLQAASNIPFELFTESFRDEIKRELEYRDAKQKWDNYVSWRDNRNPMRKETEEKYGYDTKYALHLFRLLEEGRQLLTEGKIVFPLHNAKELLEIRNGKYTYEQVIEKATEFEKQFESWYNSSTLPHSPNWKSIKELYFEILKKEGRF